MVVSLLPRGSPRWRSPRTGSPRIGLLASHGLQKDASGGSYTLIPSTEPKPDRASDDNVGPEVQGAEEQLGGGRCGRELAESNVMQGAGIFLILANALVMGFETDMPDICQWDVVENVFLLAFTIELAVRIYGLTPRVFFQLRDNPDIMWNLFDVAIVGIGLVSVLADLAAGGSSMGKDATMFRIVRLLRVLRVLRIIRLLRFLKQLYVLAYGFMESTTAVFWVMLLGSAMLYVCSVMLVRTYGHGEGDDEDQQFFVEHFGNIPRTMYSLFQLICAPDMNPYQAVMFKNPALVLFLVTYIVVGSFGINGLLVALINESILEKNGARLEEEAAERDCKRRVLKDQCCVLFDSLDVDKKQVLPQSALMSCTQQLNDMFKSLGVTCQRKDIDTMMRIMDYNSTGLIERSEFVRGIAELCEEIRPLPIMELHYQVSKCVTKVEQTDAKVDRVAEAGMHHDMKLERVQHDVECIRRAAEAAEPPLAQRRSPSLPAPSCSVQPNVASRPVRELLAQHCQALAEAQARIQAALEGPTVHQASEAAAAEVSQAELRSLEESLLDLQRSNLEVLSVVVGQAWSPGGASGSTEAYAR